jgi:hypothetical protein
VSRIRDPRERYQEKLRHEQKALEDFAAHEIEWADDLLLWYSGKKCVIPDDQYRAVAFFKNREYLLKPGSLTLLYEMYRKLVQELPNPDKEIAFDYLAYRFKVYALALTKGGF